MNGSQEYKKSNFSYAFLFLNSERRKALSVFYHFARMVDDIADSEIDKKEKKEKLNKIKNKINSVYSGEKQEGFWKEILDISLNYSIPKYCFDELVEGMIYDTEEVNIKNTEELELYMYRVAAVVGVAVLKISGYNGHDIEEISRYTGYAVQLTNILRDIEEDIKRKRIYIPLKHRLDICKKPEIKLNTEEFKSLMEFERKIAEDYYRKADELFKKNKSQKLFAASVMKNIYHEILKSLDFDKIQKNNKISFYKKLKALYKSFREII